MFYIVFLVGIFLSLTNDKKKISFTIFVVILSVLAFLRYGIGADYFAYKYLYSRLSDSLLYEIHYGLDDQEIGFRLMGTLLKKIGFSYQQYLIFIAAINIYYISKLCKKYSKNPMMSLLLYYCFYYFVWTFSGLRQGITLSIGLYYLLECIEKKNAIKFTIIVILLSLIHLSVFILLPLYFISRINFNKKQLIYLSFLSIIMSVIPIGNILTKLHWLPFLNRISPYMSSTSVSLNNILNFQSFGRIVFLFIGFFYYNSYCKQSEISKKIINVYIVSLILYFTFKFSELTAARLSIYGMLLSIIILPNIYYLYKEKINKLIYLFSILILCALYLSRGLIAMEKQAGIIKVKSNSIITPYINIYNKDDYIFNNRYLYFID